MISATCAYHYALRMQDRRARGAFGLLAIVLVTLSVLVTGCTGSAGGSTNSDNAPLPNADTLLAASSASMRTVRSVHFTLAVTGNLPSLPVTNAEGDLDSAGRAAGTAKLIEFGQLIEAKFVLINKTFYLLGPTGGWQRFPATLAGNLFDPTVILDANRGVGHVFGNVKNARTVDEETVNGVSTYKITGTVSQDVLTPLLPGLNAGGTATIWVTSDAKHLPVKGDFVVSGATIEVTVSHVNEPISVSAPS